MTDKTEAPASSGAGAANAAANAAATGSTAQALPKGNPALRMMGLPNFRLRLPSRNWTIFLTIVGSWTAAYWYDRHEKKRILQRWSDFVQHVSKEPMMPGETPRRLTVFLAAPPADGLLTAREHFHDYVKPVLAASGLDWDAIEGRKEGDVRAMLAERIRKVRARSGETPVPTELEDTEEEQTRELVRKSRGVVEYKGVLGDIVIGRNTWKEYIRGLHEGWLGPLAAPPVVQDEGENGDSNGNGYGNGNGNNNSNGNGNASLGDSSSQTFDKSIKVGPDKPHDLASIPTYAAEKVLKAASKSKHSDSTPPLLLEDRQEQQEISTSITTELPETSPNPDRKPEETKAEEESKVEEEKKKKNKRKQPPPFIGTDAYSSASLPFSIPDELQPSVTIPIPHILGFLNTPIRMYRFLMKRQLADDIGRQVAAAVLASHRPYIEEAPTSEFSSDSQSPSTQSESMLAWEQQKLLENEEAEWHKSVRKRDGERAGKESVWLDKMILDPRIAGRMRVFELSPEERERSERKDFKDLASSSSSSSS